MDVILKNVEERDLSLIRALAERLNFEFEIIKHEDNPSSDTID